MHPRLSKRLQRRHQSNRPLPSGNWCTISCAWGCSALAALWRWKKIPEPFIVVGAAFIVLAVYSVLHH